VLIDLFTSTANILLMHVNVLSVSDCLSASVSECPVCLAMSVCVYVLWCCVCLRLCLNVLYVWLCLSVWVSCVSVCECAVCVWKPAKEDVNGWCTLCFGRLNVSRPRDELPADGESDYVTSSDCEASDTNTGHRISCRGGTAPLLSIVTLMDQVWHCLLLVIHVLFDEES